MKVKAYLLIGILCIFSLTGCTSKTDKQVTAITEALEAYDEYHIEVVDLKEQVTAQAKEMDKKAETVTYNLKVTIPDMAAIAEKDLDIELPEQNWNANLNLSAFQTDAFDRLLTASRNYVAKGSKLPTKPAHINVTVTLDKDKNWNAAVSDDSIAEIDDEIQTMVTSLYEKHSRIQEMTTLINIANNRQNILTDALGDGSYVELTKIDKLFPLEDNKYQMDISYPDPTELFKKLQEKAVGLYDAHIFSAVSVTLRPSNLSDADKKACTQKNSSLIITADTGGFSVAETDLKKSISTARKDAETAASKQINEKWLIAAQGIPGTGIILGDNSGNPCIIHTSAEADGNYYLRFFQIAGSLDEKGTLVAGVFIHAGDTYEFNLPSGNYKLIFGTGEQWFGTDYMFGPDASYCQMDSIIDSEGGYYNELTLYYVPDGNTSISSVPYDGA